MLRTPVQAPAWARRYCDSTIHVSWDEAVAQDLLWVRAPAKDRDFVFTRYPP